MNTVIRSPWRGSLKTYAQISPSVLLLYRQDAARVRLAMLEGDKLRGGRQRGSALQVGVAFAPDRCARQRFDGTGTYSGERLGPYSDH
jgi:hypothetical protein